MKNITSLFIKLMIHSDKVQTHTSKYIKKGLGLRLKVCANQNRCYKRTNALQADTLSLTFYYNSSELSPKSVDVVSKRVVVVAGACYRGHHLYFQVMYHLDSCFDMITHHNIS